MLAGGRNVQPPHVDLEDGQQQSFGNVGDAPPALVHFGDRPSFEKFRHGVADRPQWIPR